MASQDELLDAHINYIIGNYTQCLKLLQTVKSTPAISLRKDILTYRTYIAQKKYAVVLDEVKPGISTCSELRALRLLAEYLSTNAVSDRSAIVKKLDELMSSALDSNDETSILMGASVYFHDGQYETALKLLRNNTDSMECLALTVHILVSIDRLDLAMKELKKMQEQNEDSPICQLSIAMVNLAGAAGESKLQEAYHIYRELADKYTPTSMLLNGQATAYMAMNRWAEAEPLLQEALDMDGNCSETIINMACLSQFLGKAPEVCSRYLSQLKDSNKNHPFILDLSTKEQDFERACKSYHASVETSS